MMHFCPTFYRVIFSPPRTVTQPNSTPTVLFLYLHPPTQLPPDDRQMTTFTITPLPLPIPLPLPLSPPLLSFPSRTPLSLLYLKPRPKRPLRPSFIIYSTIPANTPTDIPSPKTQTPSPSPNGHQIKWEAITKNFTFGPEKVLRSIATATSSPICQFIDSPPTFLHSLDPRIKLVWLVVLVFLPSRSHVYMRFGIVLFLALLSIWALPQNVWTDQLSRVTLLSLILFVTLGLTADSALPSVSWRTPPPSFIGLPSLPSSFKGYSYLIFKLGPLQLTRKGLAVASTSACLTFTILQSASLCLLTTPPEQLASALRWFLLPLVHIGVPVEEVVLTLMLSLRFINLIFDEVRNVALGILSRRIDWQQLSFMEKVDVFVMYIRRIFNNIFSQAEQISQAMIVRGFRGDSKTHRIHFSNWSISMADIISMLALFGVIAAAKLSSRSLV